jgi:hypothetical protein
VTPAAVNAKRVSALGVRRARAIADASDSTKYSMSSSLMTSGGNTFRTAIRCPATWLRM